MIKRTFPPSFIRFNILSIFSFSAISPILDYFHVTQYPLHGRKLIPIIDRQTKFELILTKNDQVMTYGQFDVRLIEIKHKT